MRSNALAEFGHVSARAIVAAPIAALWLASAIGAACAQTPENKAAGSIDLGARGGLAAGAPVRTAPQQDAASSALEFSVRAGLATDYVYRGTTLSARQPAAGAAVEAAFGMFYAGSSIATVKLPSQPAAEITMAAGIRPKLGDINFDFGWSYFAYPGEAPPPGVFAGIDYWEAVARADTAIAGLLRLAGGFAYAPNVSNTGAWSTYAAFGAGVDLPANALPHGITASMTGGAGYSWFGNQSAALGGFPLPAYLNWNAGVTFTHKSLNLDLRYYDTNLSRENCYVFTGDPGATPGGSIDPVRNPGGLTSRWCSATIVAKFWAALN